MKDARRVSWSRRGRGHALVGNLSTAIGVSLLAVMQTGGPAASDFTILDTR